MGNGLAKVQGYILLDVRDMLLQYQRKQGLPSISKALGCALIEFFEMSREETDIELEDLFSRRIAQLESIIDQLAVRVEILEGKDCKPGFKKTIVTPSSVDICNNLTHQAVSSLSRSNDSSPLVVLKGLVDEVPSELKRGLSRNALVRRLKTTPATLRKHIKLSNNLEWAIEKDPDGLGWQYEPLTERYLPILFNSESTNK